MTRLELAKQMSILDYLKSIGIEPIVKNNKAMIKAFWRGDNNASVSINLNTNRWHDFGTEQGGSIIDLVSVIENITPISAVNRLLKGSNNLFSFKASNTLKARKEESVEVLRVCDVEHNALKQYLLKDRLIPDTIYKEYLKEIHYKCNGREFFALGFAIDGGGWVLRNKHYKGCTRQNYTLIKGKEATTSDNRILIIFEGVFDFLTFLTKETKLPQTIDYLILNSTSNIFRAVPLFKGYKHIHCYLDNDAAGKTALESIKDSSAGTTISDYSTEYEPYNDLNEWHVQTTKASEI